MGRGPVATVGGTEISRSDLETLLDAQRELIEVGAEQARAQAQEPDAQFTVEDVDRSLSDQLAQIAGSGTHTISTGAANRQLAEMVQLEVLRAALARAGGEVTDEQRDQARSELEMEIGQSGLPADRVPEVIIAHYVELAAVNAALDAAVPDDVGADLGMSPEDYEQFLRDVFDENGTSYRQLCFHELIFESEEAATEAADRLEAGDDVSQVYTDLAIVDPSLEPGDCTTLPAGTLVEPLGEEVFTAEAGQAIRSGQQGGGDTGQPPFWRVVMVESADMPTFDDVRDQLTQDFPDTTQSQMDEARDQYIDDILADVVDDIEVSIDPRYGTWDPETASVVPPADPGAAPTPTGDLGDLDVVEPTL